MKYADYVEKSKELRARYRAAREAAGLEAIDAEIDALEEASIRAYDISETIQISVRPHPIGLSLGCRRREGDRIMDYLHEPGRMTAIELRHAADIREMVDRYQAGELAALPPSGRWPVVECSGISASWCPIHGDCTCTIDEDTFEITMGEPKCPLHGDESRHGEPL